MTLQLYQVFHKRYQYCGCNYNCSCGINHNLISLKVFLNKKDAENYAKNYKRDRLMDEMIIKDLTIKDNVIEALYKEMTDRKKVDNTHKEWMMIKSPTEV